MPQECLLISQQALADLRVYVKESPANCEISGLGRFLVSPDGFQYVSEVKIFKQRVTGAHAEIDAETLEQFFESLPTEERGQWRFQWHSHVNMGTSPSGTDIQDYADLIDMWKWFTPIIINKRDEFHGWLYSNAPVYGVSEFKHIWPFELRHYWSVAKTSNTPNSLQYIKTFANLAHAVAKDFVFTIDATPEREAELKAIIKELVTQRHVVPTGNYANNGVGQSRYTGYHNYTQPSLYSNEEDWDDMYGQYTYDGHKPTNKNTNLPATVSTNGKAATGYWASTSYLGGDQPPDHLFFEEFCDIVPRNSGHEISFKNLTKFNEFKKLWTAFATEALTHLVGKSSDEIGFRALLKHYGFLDDIESNMLAEGFQWGIPPETNSIYTEAWNQEDGPVYWSDTDADVYSMSAAFTEVFGCQLDPGESCLMLDLLETTGVINYVSADSYEMNPHAPGNKNWTMSDANSIEAYLEIFCYWLGTKLLLKKPTV